MASPAQDPAVTGPNPFEAADEWHQHIRRWGRAATLAAAIAELRRLARPFRDAVLDSNLHQAEARLLVLLTEARIKVDRG